MNESKVRLIPHYVDLSCPKKTSEQLRKKYGLSEDEILIIFSGRLDKNKGIYSLIESFIELVDDYLNLRLIIAGNAEFNNILIKSNPVWNKIIYVGYASRSLLGELMCMSNIGVVPSFYEEFGYSAYEQLSYELRVVCTRTSGLSRLEVGDANVMMFSHDSGNAGLINALREAINTVEDSRRIGSNKEKTPSYNPVSKVFFILR